MSQDGGNVTFWNKIIDTASYCPKGDITPVLRHQLASTYVIEQ